jgi:hypothetical protein
MAWLRRQALWGERWRLLARRSVFKRLMREHYLRGLREGLAASATPGRTG